MLNLINKIKPTDYNRFNKLELSNSYPNESKVNHLKWVKCTHFSKQIYRNNRPTSKMNKELFLKKKLLPTLKTPDDNKKNHRRRKPPLEISVCFSWALDP